jgi:hypothetical protein
MDGMTDFPTFRNGLRVMPIHDALQGVRGWRIDAKGRDKDGCPLQICVDLAGELDDEVLERALKVLNNRIVNWPQYPVTAEQVRERAAELVG